MLASALALLLALQAAPHPDSVAAVRARARDAEAAFERLARRLIPTSLDRPTGRPCDEIVGRFCLTYGSFSYVEPAPEAGPVVDARREAIEALRLALAHDPADLETAVPLVRYLVEDGRAREAASLARLYASRGADGAWADLLLGFALHAAGEDASAEPLLVLGMQALFRVASRNPGASPDAATRNPGALPDAAPGDPGSLAWLLPRAERERWRRLQGEARATYAARFWGWADPLWMTPANERRAEHLARHVWARMLARAPVVAGMNRWGEDLDQLTVRYGIPTGRTRSWGAMPGEGSLVEHYGDDQLAFDPTALLVDGLPAPPPPGAAWELAEEAARSGYAPAGLGAMAALEHQLSRFPEGAGWEVRVDAAAPVGELEAALILRDTLLAADAVVARHRVVGAASPQETSRWSLVADAPPGAWVYSAEARVTGAARATGAAWRARYALELPRHGPGPRLSDVVVARPFGGGPFPDARTDPALAPRSSLVLPRGAQVGLYAEAHGMEGRTYTVTLRVERADEPSILGRAAGWLGRTLGLSDPPEEPRLRWEGRAPATGPAVVAVDLDLAPLPPGLHRIILEVAVGRERAARTERLIRIAEG